MVSVSKRSTKDIFTLVILTLIYLAAGKFGLSLALINSSTSAIWPPTGIALAAMLILGPRVWPAIFVGAFITNISTTGNLTTSLFIAIGNTLEALLGQYLINRFAQGKRALNRPVNIFRFTAAAAVACALGATIGTFTQLLGGLMLGVKLVEVWFTWWLGDLGGALLVATAILLVYNNRRFSWGWKKIGELLLITITTVLASLVIFSGLLPFPYLITPAILLVAFNFGKRETIFIALIISIIAIRFTLVDQGPFAVQSMGDTNKALLYVQIFLAVLVVTKLLVASLVVENRKTEAVLRASSRRFKALIEKSSDVVELIDADSRVSYVSPSVETVLGYSPAEFMDLVGFDLVHPDDQEFTKTSLLGITKAPYKSATIEVRVKRKDDAWVWVQANMRNLISDPAVGQIVVNFRDINDRKQLEAAKDDFIMIAAHQLREPLTAMRWNLELLKKDAKAGGHKDKIDQVYRQNVKMVMLVNEFLGASRISQGDIPYLPELVSIDQHVKDEVSNIAQLAKKEKLKLSYHAQSNLPKVNLDPRYLRETIQNLLSNSLKYTQPGGEIKVDLSQQKKSLIITVTDNGIGIPVSEQSRLFTKFFRGTNAKEIHAEGTGLGLYVAKTYVEHWGGSLEIISPATNQKGTTVKIYIPIKK